MRILATNDARSHAFPHATQRNRPSSCDRPQHAPVPSPSRTHHALKQRKKTGTVFVGGNMAMSPPIGIAILLFP